MTSTNEMNIEALSTIVPSSFINPHSANSLFLSIPTEVRQHILILATSDFCPFGSQNARRLLMVPRYDRAEYVHRFSRSHFTEGERRAYAHICRLYQVSSTIIVEMTRVERIWLMHRMRWPPLNLADFATYAAAPVPVNRILTLSLFDALLIANPPQIWERTVHSLTDETDVVTRKCGEYMRAWRQAIMSLPVRGARDLRIEAVEVVDLDVKLLGDNNFLLENQGWVRESSIARFEILLMMRLGLRIRRVRVMRPVIDKTRTVVRMPWA